MKDKLLNDMVDYIEVTDNVISDLKGQPKFSDEALTKAAAALVDAALIQSENQEELVELFRTDPDKALESIEKVAANLPKAPSGDYSLGGPGEQAAPSRHKKESDRVLYEKLGLA
jgi:hypothetical protein